VAEAFGLDPKEDLLGLAKIAGYANPVSLSPPDSHFSDVSLLGMDFSSVHGLVTRVIAGSRVVTFHIGEDWDVNRKPKL
jgi:hypothetical protein